jgi:hypothetical protein
MLGPKRLEDLRLGHPSLAWSLAARTSNEKDFAEFIRAARMLPDESYVRAWVGRTSFEARLRQEALARADRLAKRVSRLAARTHPRASRELLGLIESLRSAYDREPHGRI